MIYNLAQLLKDNTSLTIFVNGYDDDTRGVAVNQTGGEESFMSIKNDFTVQFMSRADTRVAAYEDIMTVYNYLKNRFIVVLPEVTINEITYPSITVYGFVPIQIPGYVGTDENRLHMWSVNIQIITGGS